MARSPRWSTWIQTCGSRGYARKTDETLPCATKICAGLDPSPDQLLGGPPRRVSSPRLRPGSTLGLGLGAFLVSFLPLSLLPIKPNMTQIDDQREKKSLRFDRTQILNRYWELANLNAEETKG